MLNLENKTYVIMGIANKRSIAFGVAKVLHHLYEIDVQNDEDIINGFSQIGKDVGQIDGVYHSIAFANMEDLRGRFSETSREGFLLAQEISSYSLTLVAHEAKNLCLKVEVLLRRLILVVRQQFKTIMLWV